MRVFISSVRRGLEVERDSLVGLIQAMGHEPVRFEDFSALPVPSREACLRGVQSSDVYLMLLGPHYGHVFPETGQSATHDEYAAAITQGMPRLVFRKAGVNFEPEQEALARQVGDYGSGVFYAGFESAVDLQTKVVQALQTLAAAPSTLSYQALASPISIGWREEWSGVAAGFAHQSLLEIHAVPVDGHRRSARLMAALSDQLVSALRASGALPATDGVIPTVSATAVVIELAERSRGSYRDIRAGVLRGVRVAALGQASLWWSLPGDSLGTILDANDLQTTVARSLRLLGALRLLDGDRFVLAIGLDGLSMVSEGTVSGVARQSASMGYAREGSIHTDPDESVSAAAFDRGADEVAATLVQALLTAFRSRP